MTTDPRDAEIARLREELEAEMIGPEIERSVYSDKIADLEAEVDRLTAERDAALAQVAEPYAWVIPGDDSADCYGFIDAKAYEEGEFSKPLYAVSTDALAALPRRDAQMRAEGRKEGLLEAAKICTRGDDRAAILAAAEKEAGNG